MKKILTTLSTLGVIIFLCSHTSSPTTLDYLTAPEMWKEKISGDTYHYIQFTKTHISGGMMVKGEKYMGSSLYYLSDLNNISVFDSSKVGQVSNGKYIVMARLFGSPGECEFYEIKSIDSKELTLFYDSKGKNIPGQVTSIWQAIYE